MIMTKDNPKELEKVTNQTHGFIFPCQHFSAILHIIPRIKTINIQGLGIQ